MTKHGPVTAPPNKGIIITACVSPGEHATDFRHQLGLLKAMLRVVHDQVKGSSFLLVLPAGYFDSGPDHPRTLYRRGAHQIARCLRPAPVGSTICFGVDGSGGQVQLGAAVTREGLMALGRKFYPAPGETRLDRAKSPYSLEEGLPRTFTFNGRTYYLSVCYDTFGLKKRSVPNHGVGGIIGLVHYFGRSGQPMSGAPYFARYGFAGVSKAWGCPVYGAVVFHGEVQQKWPTAVLWDKGALDTKRWRYGDNPLIPEVVQELEYGQESAMLSFYPTLQDRRTSQGS